jgi:hypothetical protein
MVYLTLLSELSIIGWDIKSVSAFEHWIASENGNPDQLKLVEQARSDAFGTKFQLHRNDSSDVQAKTIREFFQDPSAADFDLQKQSLNVFAAAKIDIAKQPIFNRYMTEFESRIGDRAEVARTYSQLNVLLSSPVGAIDEQQRIGTALDLIYHAAEGHVDQGRHLTCAPSALEERVLSRKPSIAAEMVVSAAVAGEWIAQDGKTIKLDKDSLNATGEETNYPPIDGWRSQASQIFQVTVLNDISQRTETPHSFLQKSQSGFTPLRTLEAIVGYRGEYWRDPNGAETKFRGLPPKYLADENERLLGDRNVVLNNVGVRSSSKQVLSNQVSTQQALTEQQIEISNRSGVQTFNSVVSLEQELSTLKESKLFPVMIGVDQSNHELPGYGGILPDLDMGANHVVSLTDYDSVSQQVYVRNSQGSQYDGWISIHDLYDGSL